MRENVSSDGERKFTTEGAGPSPAPAWPEMSPMRSDIPHDDHQADHCDPVFLERADSTDTPVRFTSVGATVEHGPSPWPRRPATTVSDAIWWSRGPPQPVANRAHRLRSTRSGPIRRPPTDLPTTEPGNPKDPTPPHPRPTDRFGPDPVRSTLKSDVSNRRQSNPWIHNGVENVAPTTTIIAKISVPPMITG